MNGHRRSFCRFGAVVVGAFALAAPDVAYAANDYLIEEVTYYAGAGCGTSVNLNDVTSALRDALVADGRNGVRYTNTDAWPQDFTEACSSVYGTGGTDNIYADNFSLSVFAGHGNSNPTNGPALIFGAPHLGMCTANLFSNVRLGQMSGGQSAFAIYGASCVMRADKIQSHVLKQWLRQQLGFHNSPIIDDPDIGDFYNDTNSYANKTAWLNDLESRPGWFSGSNSPMVVSRGNSDSEAWSTHDGFAFAYGSQFWTPLLNQPVCTGGQGAYWWYYTYKDNGGC